jgi:hypothetical protein
LPEPGDWNHRLDVDDVLRPLSGPTFRLPTGFGASLAICAARSSAQAHAAASIAAVNTENVLIFEDIVIVVGHSLT